MFTFMLAIVHNCFWINSILKSNGSIQILIYLCTLTRYLLHTHVIMLGLTLSFCKVSRVILLNYHCTSTKLRHWLTGNVGIKTAMSFDIYVYINKLYVSRVDLRVYEFSHKIVCAQKLVQEIKQGFSTRITQQRYDPNRCAIISNWYLLKQQSHYKQVNTKKSLLGLFLCNCRLHVLREDFCICWSTWN